MVAYSFKPRFVPSIESGVKCQTIRAPRRRHARPGEILHLFQGMRTRSCRLIGTPLTSSISDIRMDLEGDVVATEFWRLSAAAELDSFAVRDGFDDWADLKSFWATAHPGSASFSGVVVTWSASHFLRRPA